MQKILSVIFLGIILLSFKPSSPVSPATIAEGHQPRLSADSKGTLRIVFGRPDSIFCITSVNGGNSFSKPVLVGRVPGMHLGMWRAPQLASSANYSVITAMDKTGNIHWYRLNHSGGGWENMGVVNDVHGSAPEGLMSIAADENDHFYAVWLDIRTGKRNQMYFSSLSAASARWTKNLLAYRSPDGHVCECCQPHIAVRGKKVALQFRNWLGGSRDLYIVTSTNAGISFGPAEKLGHDTWKLNACPMDGGGISINRAGVISTAWQRKGAVYFCVPGKPEVYIQDGRNCSLSPGAGQPVLTFENNDTVKLIRPANKQPAVVGKGGFAQSLVVGNQVYCVWESDDRIRLAQL